MGHRRLDLVVACLAACLCFHGCAGVSRVADLPPDAGVLATYDVPAEEVARVVPEALSTKGQRLVESAEDSSSVAVYGMRGANLWDMGEVSRTLATSRPAGGSDVRVTVRSRYVLDFFSRAGTSLHIVAAIDRLLGPGAITLAEGDRVRAVTAGGATEEGILLTDESGRLVMSPDGVVVDPGLALDGLTRIEIERGSYGHARLGTTVGFGLGFIYDFFRCYDPLGGLGEPRCGSVPVGILVGTAVGGLLGSVIRTSIWSDARSER